MWTAPGEPAAQQSKTFASTTTYHLYSLGIATCPWVSLRVHYTFFAT